MPVDVSKQRLPSAEDEARFWVRVEAAWAQGSAEANRVRRALAARVLGDPEAAVLDAECEEMCYFFAHLYCEALRGIPGDRLGNFPRIMFEYDRLGQLTRPSTGPDRAGQQQ